MRPLDTTGARLVAWDDPSKVGSNAVPSARTQMGLSRTACSRTGWVEAHPFGESQDEAVWSDDHWLSL